MGGHRRGREGRQEKQREREKERGKGQRAGSSVCRHTEAEKCLLTTLGTGSLTPAASKAPANRVLDGTVTVQSELPAAEGVKTWSPPSLGQHGAPPGEERKEGSTGTSWHLSERPPWGQTRRRRTSLPPAPRLAHSDADPRAGHDCGAPSPAGPHRLRGPVACDAAAETLSHDFCSRAAPPLPQGLLCRGAFTCIRLWVPVSETALVSTWQGKNPKSGKQQKRSRPSDRRRSSWDSYLHSKCPGANGGWDPPR